MKLQRFLVLFIIWTYSYTACAQTYWKIETEYGDEILLTIEINKGSSTFEAYTRKNALKDIAGTIIWTLAKTTGKLTYPEIVHIEGKMKQVADSLILTGNFTYFDKQFPFTSIIRGNQFQGFYTDRNRQRKLTGIKLLNNKPIRDYPAIINSAFAIAEKNLANPVWTKSPEWKEFKDKINELKPNIADDYELAASIEWLRKKLPFSTFELNKINPESKPAEKKSKVAIRELNSETVIFDANTFPASLTETDSIAEIFAKKRYANLILDLRGRNSITPCAANQVLNFVSENKGTPGVYLTRKWFSGNTFAPQTKDYNRFLKSFAVACFAPNEFYRESGRFFDISPIQNGFKGKVFIITDSKTSKVSEILVYLLKSEKRATITGQKTAGISSFVEQFPLSKEFHLRLPVAEFYNSLGKSTDKNGIEPDLTVTREDALKYILKNLKK